MNERQIFEGALEFTRLEDRRVFLDKACGDNATLRAAVEALLAAHEAPSEFLNDPAVKQLGLDRTLDHSVNHNNENDETEITFLQPPAKPGSIGRLGHYEILQILGRGAFGIVFRAFDEKLHRQVAIKTMTPQLAATSPPRKRFLREARSVAQIKHENIVQIYSVEEEPLPYLVMEFVQGQTLQQKLDGVGPLDPPEILHLGRQMAAGLAAAHAQGLIHRDIKPGNILLEQGAEQKVKITDFGLARAADDASMTQTGVIAGTPLYMAPEQALGETLDARSDLFSLGSVLYQMATGRAAFRAPTTIAVLRRVVDDTPRDMSDVIPGLPKWLVAIVMKLLAKRREERYQTAQEVCDVLTKCQQELQVHGRVTTIVPETPNTVPTAARSGQESFSAKNGTLRLFGLAAALMLLIGVPFVYRTLIRRFQASTAVSDSVPQKPPKKSLEPDLRAIDVLSLIDPTLDRWNLPGRTGKNVWRMEGGALIAETDALPSKLLLPLDSDWPSFECELEFTRRSGVNGFNLNLPTKAGECPLVLDPPNFGGMHLGSRQRGKEFAAGAQIETGKRLTLKVTVHRASNRDLVTISLDGTQREWAGDLSAIANVNQEGFPADRRLSLWIQGGSGFIFHRLEVRIPDSVVVKSLRSASPAMGWHGLPADAPKPAIAPFDKAQAKKYQEDWAAYLEAPVEFENSLGMKFRLIPPGEFTMGSTATEVASQLQEIAPNDKHWPPIARSEEPRHRVILTVPIYLGVTEVTQAEYQQVMGKNPSHYRADGAGAEVLAGLNTRNYPVEMVSWNDAAEFCARLSANEKLKPHYFRAGETVTALEGTGYRLPSEAEWEFACRAGTTTRYWTGDDDEDLARAGWFGGNSGLRTHAAAELRPNPFGLFDTHGNVWEWVQDGWGETSYTRFQDRPAINPSTPFTAETFRVLRGGNFLYRAPYCRSACRGANVPSIALHDVGFRLSLSIEAVKALTKTQSGMTGKSDGAESLADYYARNRRAAERVLSIGDESSHLDLEIVQPFELRHLTVGQSLPESPFVVRSWSLKNSTRASNDDLDVLAGLRHISDLNLMTKGGLDAGCVPKIAAIRSPLKVLGVGHIKLKTSDLSRLPVMPNVDLLWLSVDQVDDGWKFLNRFPALRSLMLYGAPLPDLLPLGDVPHLRRVQINGWGPEPDAKSIAELQKRHPNLRIHYEAEGKWRAIGTDPAIAAGRRLVAAGIPVRCYDPAGVEHSLDANPTNDPQMMRLFVRSIPRDTDLKEDLRALLTHVDLQNLTAEGRPDADALALVLQDRQDLDILNFRDSDLSDTGLRRLHRLQSLRWLVVNGTKVTADGITAIRRAIPGCRVHSDHGDFEPDFFPAAP